MNSRRKAAFLFFAAGAMNMWSSLASEAPRLNLELKPDPKVMAELKNLGENSSLLLPPVNTAGEMNDEVRRLGLDKSGPKPRNYSLKWVWSGDRKRSFFCGGNAGVPHRLNDVWEYDLPSNTWVLLWTPDPDLSQLEGAYSKGDPQARRTVDSAAQVKDGVLMTQRGAPFDPVHTWWGLTYDPNTKAMLWVMGNQNKVGYKFQSNLPWGKIDLWAYYPYENRWEFVRPNENSPPGQNASILEYIPDLKAVLWYTNTWRGESTSLFNSTAKTWKELCGKKEMHGKPDYPGPEAVAAYDTKNKVLVVHLGGDNREGTPAPKCTYHYDVVRNKWEKALESNEGPVGNDSRGPMVYDSAARRCYIVQDGLWSYRVEDKKWEKLTPQGPPPPNGMACYNPELNVTMVDSGSGRVWVYRGKLAPSDSSR